MSEKRTPRTQRWPLTIVINQLTVSSRRLYRGASTRQDCANTTRPLSSRRTRTIRTAFRQIKRASDTVDDLHWVWLTYISPGSIVLLITRLDRYLRSQGKSGPWIWDRAASGPVASGARSRVVDPQHRRATTYAAAMLSKLQDVHRRFETWCDCVLRQALTDIANELRDRGAVDEKEC